MENSLKKNILYYKSDPKTSEYIKNLNFIEKEKIISIYDQL